MTDAVTRDETYPDADLVGAYIARRGVKTFHVRKPGTKTITACGLKLEDLIEAGWARGVSRRGLEPCGNGCAAVLAAALAVDSSPADE